MYDVEIRSLFFLVYFTFRVVCVLDEIDVDACFVVETEQMIVVATQCGTEGMYGDCEWTTMR